MNKLIEKIRSRGYWKIVIRPTTFDEDHVKKISTLVPIIEESQVQLRGWYFPHNDNKKPPEINYDWVQQATDWQEFVSLWRFYQSGQFFMLMAMPIDWREQSSWWSENEILEKGLYLPVADTFFQITEIFEFAARLSLTSAGDEEMFLQFSLNNLAGRLLLMDLPKKWGFWKDYQTSMATFPFEIKLTRDELISSSRERARIVTTKLFERFGWEVSPEVLEKWQSDLFERR